MYETEANVAIESAEQIAPEILTAFGSLGTQVVMRTVLPWSEHCTECVWPTCYTTCDLYSPREDGRCRRFVDGMVRIDCPGAVNGYLLKIRFKRWAKMWTPGNIRLHSAEKALKIEKRDQRLGSFLYQLELPASLKKTVIGKRYSLKKRLANRASSGEDLPTCFLVECFNPASQTISLSFTIRSADTTKKIPFQKLIALAPGYNAVRIPQEEISAVIDLRSPFHLELVPNGIGEELTLYFGLVEFVREIPARASSKAGGKKQIKCVVWDLDNTVWDGILVEDGVDNLRLKPGIVNIIETLDRRGILQSIASKNNFAEAIEALSRFGLDQFFLHPQISWAPKSAAVAAVAQQLNIGIDTLMFVDDSEFELNEVKMSCPEVLVVNSKEYPSLLDRKECQVPVTAESAERRKMYQVESERQTIAASFKDDYKAFLRHCNIQLQILPFTEDNIERVHELTQRTNQMNFSGNRYEREALEKMLQSTFLDVHVLACEDRFGSYGIVGLGIVDNREPRLVDLMFSCRIQSKRVEHAFLTFLIRKYTSLTNKDFHANYRKTPKNAPSGQVFADIGMLEETTLEGVTSLVYPRNLEIADDGIIEIVALEGVVAGA